ncbi:hypothetical protein EGM51_10585 [Verrucomicrobia bacterium S94]|nr:hypothetical protein EGM51_10585 [Verrucomicrobia bacterium S94]
MDKSLHPWHVEQCTNLTSNDWKVFGAASNRSESVLIYLPEVKDAEFFRIKYTATKPLIEATTNTLAAATTNAPPALPGEDNEK